MAPVRERRCIKSRVMPYFELVSEAPKKYKCLIGKYCKIQNGNHEQNLVNHARTHKEWYEENIDTDPQIKKAMPVMRLEFIQRCTEIVTTNKAPFAALNWSGLRKLNEETIRTLTDAGYGVGLNPPKCRAVKEHIKHLTSEIIAQIKREVDGKFVSLMVDTAKKYHRSILGINLQFMLDSKIAIRSIGMVHLTKSHTSRHLADKILERLSLFGISTSQLISITTDNASNMTAMIDRFNEAYNEENADNDSGDSEDDEEVVASANASEEPFVFSDVNELQASLDKVVSEMESEETDDLMELLQEQIDYDALLLDLEKMFAEFTLNINSIRCAAHTLQLAVMEALNIDEFKLLIRLARVVCKELRKDSNIIELRENKVPFKIPRIDCDTRWNSIYIMVCN